MKKIKLHTPRKHALLAAFSCGYALFSPNHALAGLAEATNIGTYTGATITINNLNTPFKAFADYGAANQGWMHTATFFTLNIGSQQDIAAGKTYDVQLNMTGFGNTGNTGTAAIDNPAFALWTAGTNTIDPSLASGQHGWNPMRGPNEEAVNVDGANDKLNINESFRQTGVLNGHSGWIGYVNAGPSYILENQNDPLMGDPQTASGKAVQDAVGHGALNTSSKTWLTNPAASSTTYSNNNYLQNDSMIGNGPDSASMTLFGLKAGHYLIATGGSCPTNPTPKTVCGIGTQFSFSVQAAKTEVQEQNAQYTASNLTATIQDVQVQDQRYAVKLQLQSNNTFRLTSAVNAALPLKSKPAQYDANSGVLSIPRIDVSGKAYFARLQHIGNFDFRLVDFGDVK